LPCWWCGITTSCSKEIMLQPDHVWQHALTFLSPSDLCSVALVSHEFHGWAVSDRLWEPHCHKQWEGKQGRKERFLSKANNNLSWKQRYAWAAFDGQRQTITFEEFCYFSWRLLYNGQPSKLGLRKFSPDGTYHSPYAGRLEWTLVDNHLLFMGIGLKFERNLETWGWIIGRGTGTVYYSVDANDQ